MEKDGIDTSPTELLKKISSKSSLHIGRVPKKPLAAFKGWAAEEFEEDWGMAFKWLWDYYEGSLLPKESHVTVMIQDLATRIDAIEEKAEKSEENTITMGSGRTIRKRS